MSPVFAATLFGAIAAGVSLLALICVQLAARFTRNNAPLFAAFAAGLVVSIAILHLIPEALELTSQAPILVLAGFAAGFLLQRGIELFSGSRRQAGTLLALAPVIAIGLHSLVDGSVYAVTFSVDTFTGISAVLGLVIHEFPEAIICFVLLQRAGIADRSAFGWAFLAAGVTTFAAAAISAPFAAQLAPALLGSLFAIVAGLMLHVGAGHLLAQAGEAGWLRATPMVLLGGLAALALTLFHPAADHDAHAAAPEPRVTHR